MKLSSGPDEGETTAVKLNVGPGAPGFSPGDQVRVMKNKIPPGAYVAQVDDSRSSTSSESRRC